ncbi:uracil-DNA glycosylase [Paenibacillus silagei]|uniref:DNA polymerase n=1 Tax=Paenibacillus silagei TaxID=1670801 RepID=A0ABS4NVM4_9BACL|nr:uracil-DNA glycosylase [Paenibacillus silagei]MBP2114098.1 DNA polymerase [Paenibacillus silagei]
MLKDFLEKIENKECPNCPRMSACKPVLQITELDIKKTIMFIAEAPGRLGAESSRIPLYGDQTGKNFEELLLSAKLNRQQCYITNAVLCVPIDERGNNSTPKESEIRNCSGLLLEQIQIIKPRLIVTLGKSALMALYKISKHQIKIPIINEKPSVHDWNGFKVLALYHPSPKVMNMFRNKGKQYADFKVIQDWLKEN